MDKIDRFGLYLILIELIFFIIFGIACELKYLALI